jgi:hypothetical protein
MNQLWYAEVELEGKIQEDEDAYLRLVEVLVEDSATVGESPSGQVSVRVAMEAESAQEAAHEAMETVTYAARLLGLNRTILGLELITEKEMDRRLAMP